MNKTTFSWIVDLLKINMPGSRFMAVFAHLLKTQARSQGDSPVACEPRTRPFLYCTIYKQQRNPSMHIKKRFTKCILDTRCHGCASPLDLVTLRACAAGVK